MVCRTTLDALVGDKEAPPFGFLRKRSFEALRVTGVQESAMTGREAGWTSVAADLWLRMARPLGEELSFTHRESQSVKRSAVASFRLLEAADLRPVPPELLAYSC